MRQPSPICLSRKEKAHGYGLRTCQHEPTVRLGLLPTAEAAAAKADIVNEYSKRLDERLGAPEGIMK